MKDPTIEALEAEVARLQGALKLALDLQLMERVKIAEAEVARLTQASLMELVREVENSFEDRYLSQSEASKRLTHANDNSTLGDATFTTMAEKEAYIIAEGRKANIEFTFID
jgi:post-segregation antitoxin (ccd killing protein)